MCGIAFIRTKPDFNHPDPLWTLKTMNILLEKQSNRGQDGAGIVSIKLNTEPGIRYISRSRSIDSQPIVSLFQKIWGKFKNLDQKKLSDPDWLYRNVPFTGEVVLGHIRYGTYGLNSIESCHPFLRLSNWKSKNLSLVGNFNLTNVDDLFQKLISYGQHPKEKSDTVTILEMIGHALDQENERLFTKFKGQGLQEAEIYKLIEKNLDLELILKKSSKEWDGGYVICGIIGTGDAFILRDPSGIRPCFYYEDDGVFVAASERQAIAAAIGTVDFHKIKELNPGSCLIINQKGVADCVQIHKPKEIKQCSFERIYFSKSNDAEIYQERKNLGRNLVASVLKEIGDDFENTIFTYIPSTAETAFQGLIDGLRDSGYNPIAEKLISKDSKFRTFIINDQDRESAVDTTYNLVWGLTKPNSTIVVMDDSIVRGTTLKKGILKLLTSTEPKKIIIVSSCPQIRYPDCYGIDMVKMSDFIAFQATIKMLSECDINKIYNRAIEELDTVNPHNVVSEIYQRFTDEQISDKISQFLKPEGYKGELVFIFQSLEGLRKAIPNHLGDWYFSGTYPTPGGNGVVCKSFINSIDGVDKRAY